MKEAWNFTRCAAVLRGEIALIKEISAVQNKARQAAVNREWDDFDTMTGEVNRLGGEFARLENERVRLFSALTGRGVSVYSASIASAGETPFYAAVSVLPFEERRELSYLYRELKTETLKMRALNETFAVYLDEARTVAAAYIEAVCPARGGKLYTRKGRRVSQDLKSIVLNNRF